MKRILNITKTEAPYIGIDIAKESVVGFIDSTGEQFSCRNESKELRKLARRLGKLKPALIVPEASGGYERPCAEAFDEASLPFSIAFPRRVRQFALGLGVIAKTDEIDAKMIAWYGRTAQIEPTPLATPEQRELRALAIRRSQLIEMPHCQAEPARHRSQRRSSRH